MGNTETMKLTRTEPVGWTGKTTRELRRIARQRKRDCAIVGVCAKGTKKELNTLDEADFVRDVAKSASHQLSQTEIGSDNVPDSYPRTRAQGPLFSINRADVGV